MSASHRYTAHTAWSGSTAAGYDSYTRAHEGTCQPAAGGPETAAAGGALPLTADPAFKGDPTRLNPEQLFVLAVSSCQLLTFLAVAARARVDVVAYEDDAEGEMPEDDKPVRITRITLRPTITVTGDAPDDERLRQLVETAHRHCFIANSVASEIAIEPAFRRVA